MSEKPLALILQDRQALYAHYLPYLKRGGLFVPTNRRFRPGALLDVLVQLPDGEPTLRVKGSLVWRTPVAAQGRKLPGVGVHFLEEASPRHYIEELLAGLLNSDKPTHAI